MKLERTWLAATLICGGAAAIAVIPACGGDDADSTFAGGGTSGTSGLTSGGTSGFGGSSGTSSGASGASGSGSSGTASSSGFNADAGACAATKFAADKSAANFLFIVDRSGSMNCNPPPTTSSATCEVLPKTADTSKPTKWSIQRDALKGAIAALPSTHSAGLTYFNTNDDCAVVEAPSVAVSPITPAQIDLVTASLDNAKAPFGFTPIIGAVTLGYSHLHTTATFTGKKVLVLLTDGAETCRPDLTTNFIDKTVKDASLVGITTFVIGAPGSELNRAFLSQMAFNGGSAKSPTCKHTATPENEGDCHFDLTNAGDDLATQLNAALDAISKKALGCEYDIPTATAAIDYSKVNVIYTPGGGTAQTVQQDTSAGCDQGANGWQYSADRKRISLCGTTCTTVKADPGGAVSIALGCLTETAPK